MRTGLGMRGDRPQSKKSALPFLHVFPVEQESAMSGCRSSLVEESAGSCCMRGMYRAASWAASPGSKSPWTEAEAGGRERM